MGPEESAHRLRSMGCNSRKRTGESRACFLPRGPVSRRKRGFTRTRTMRHRDERSWDDPNVRSSCPQPFATFSFCPGWMTDPSIPFHLRRSPTVQPYLPAMRPSESPRLTVYVVHALPADAGATLGTDRATHW